jgi:hypothetical protein
LYDMPPSQTNTVSQMSRIRPRYLTLAVATVLTGLVVPNGPSATAADPVVVVNWDGSRLTVEVPPVTTVSCVGATIRFNAAALPSPIACNLIGYLDIRPAFGTLGSTAILFDLRPVRSADFTRLTGTTVSGTTKSTIYGTEFADQISLSGGKAFGLGGADRLFSPGSVNATSELWGGPGNDNLVTAGGTLGTVRLEGGDGDDKLEHESALGSAAGGPGNDTIFVTSFAVNAFGGPGNDGFSGMRPGPPSARVVDGGAGGDYISVFATTFPPPLTARKVPDPEQKIEVSEGASVLPLEQMEFVTLHGGNNKAFDITMDPVTVYKVVDGARHNLVLTVRVPGGVWTQLANSVTAPGLGSVTWTALPRPPFTITIVAA